MNPCPCGQLGDVSGLCGCTADQIARYRSRISGPLLDRIDLQVEMSRPHLFLSEHSGPKPEGSDEVRGRVIAVRACLRILKVARTLADLEGEADIRMDHLAEALSYRNCGVTRAF